MAGFVFKRQDALWVLRLVLRAAREWSSWTQTGAGMNLSRGSACKSALVFDVPGGVRWGHLSSVD